MTRSGKVAIGLLGVVAAGTGVWLLRSPFSVARPVSLEGAVMVRSGEVEKQAPIPNVRISVAEGLATRDTWSSPTGYFKLTLKEPIHKGEPVILQFRHPQYMPLDLPLSTSGRLIVARLVPLGESDAAGVAAQTAVSNITIRYSVRATTLLNAGSIVKTFRVVNTGNIPCNGHHPCSPDGKWKATVGSASLEAPRDDIFSNARVSCIAGPCPFTSISSDGFSRSGPSLHVAILNWSDTVTFLFEAEVFRSMRSESTRVSYPVIFGPTLHFSVPADAEGVYIEADIDRDSIVFPLGPEPRLSWASCAETTSADGSKSYQCKLNPGFSFK
jgi:hypothetical protein